MLAQDMAMEKKKSNLGRLGYADNADFLTTAFQMYCQGVNGSEIARRLQKDYPGIVRQSVARVIKKFDWEKARARYLELRIDGTTEKTQILADLRTCREKLMTIIKSDQANHQHFAQLCRVNEQIAVFAGWDPRMGNGGAVALSTDLEQQAYLDALDEDEVVGPVIKKRKAQIKKAFDDKMRELNGSGKRQD
jgi:hypothetical protein